MHTSHRKPFYLVEANNPVIAEHQFLIMAAAVSPKQMLAMSVAPEVVDLKDVSTPHEIILALQHRPEYIEKLLFTMQFDFQYQTGIESFMPEEEWKMKPKYLKWFRAMSKLEIMPFFVKDKDVRLYMLAGDYLASGRTPVQKRVDEEGRIKYMITGGAMMTGRKRLFDCCKMFMFYCHGTGFDPKDAIVSLLDSYTLPVHYNEIYKQYQKDMKHYAAIYSSQNDAYRFKAA